MKYNLDNVLQAMDRLGYNIFENDTLPYNINHVAIRNLDTRDSDTFNDILLQFYFYNDQTFVNEFEVTVDPGIYYRNYPINNDGTGILMQGQYKDMHSIGKHNNQYEALVQVNECKVIRDINKDNMLDFISVPDARLFKTYADGNIINYIYKSKSLNCTYTVQKGLFGINIHHLSFKDKPITASIGKYSAACTVFANYSKDYIKFLDTCKKSIPYYGNNFTYTLINSDEL